MWSCLLCRCTHGIIIHFYANVCFILHKQMCSILPKHFLAFNHRTEYKITHISAGSHVSYCSFPYRLKILHPTFNKWNSVDLKKRYNMRHTILPSKCDPQHIRINKVEQNENHSHNKATVYQMLVGFWVKCWQVVDCAPIIPCPPQGCALPELGQWIISALSCMPVGFIQLNLRHPLLS